MKSSQVMMRTSGVSVAYYSIDQRSKIKIVENKERCAATTPLSGIVLQNHVNRSQNLKIKEKSVLREVG